jgi:Ca-activated chloride channel family protein
MKTSRTAFVGTVILFLAVATTGVGQNATPADPKTQPGVLVKLNLIITDRSNHSLEDVRREDIQVFEDKQPQSIVLFEKDEHPTDYGIAIDTSRSLLPVLGSLLDAVKVIIENKRPDDKVFIERFVSSDTIENAQDFTEDKDLLLAARSQIRVQGGQTAVIDGLYVAVEHTAKRGQKERRKAVVLITDGEDRSSFYSLEKLVKLLHETNVQVFIIGIVTKLENESLMIRASPRVRAEKLLTTIARESGGRLFLPANPRELETATAEIVHDLRSQFVVGYYSTNDPGKTGFRKVEVKVMSAPKTQKLNVIAPRGYYMNAPGQEQKNETKNP